MKLKQTAFIVGIIAAITCALFVSQVTPAAADCAGVRTSIINCGGKAGSGTVMWLLLTTINIMAVGVGIAAVGGIVWASILYGTAGGNSGQVAKAKTIIANVVVGLVAFALMFSLLNFLIPGGVFNAAKTSANPSLERTIAAKSISVIQNASAA